MSEKNTWTKKLLYIRFEYKQMSIYDSQKRMAKYALRGTIIPMTVQPCSSET